ncbi:MAG: serine/threonine protein kinase [Defluviitaleaceae bacterium]|nr:serine/threonine protein kinase [Defluviitaleaceae bacterium]MCL2275792.1 serine/threonine protein kinase [Defluviitaleaceae bacterium]
MSAFAGAYILETLEEMAVLSNKNDCRTTHVRDMVDGTQYIKKAFGTTYGIGVYKALLTVSHPNLPKVYYVIEDGDGFITLEEYIYGITLKTMIESKPIPFSRVMEITAQLYDALNTLHSQSPPLIHKDVNPSNIMLAVDGTIKLIDFNAAKEYKPEATEDTTTLGTKSYAAPEQFGYAKTDERTDIYCLGATMYHMLAGKPYVNGKKMPSGFAGKVMQKCLQIDPNNRYSTALGMKQRITAGFEAHERLIRFFPDLNTTSSIKFSLLTMTYIVIALVSVIFLVSLIYLIETFIDVMGYGTFLLCVYLIPVSLIVNFMGLRNKLPLFREKKIIYTLLGIILISIILATLFLAAVALIILLEPLI